MIIEVVSDHHSSTDEQYLISVTEEIRRVLSTRKGAIPMNPDYGSDLWKYRDRTLDAQTRLGVINASFDAIETAVTRVVPTRVEIIPVSDGKWGLKVSIKNASKKASVKKTPTQKVSAQRRDHAIA